MAGSFTKYEPGTSIVHVMDVKEPCYIYQILTSNKSKYQILQDIDRGAFGTVFKAMDMSSNTMVAIKSFSNHRKLLDTDENFRKNIWSKAEKEFQMCKLFKESSNIIEALDMFFFYNLPCVVFEMFDENLLRFILKNGALPIKTVCPLVRQLLQGLQALRDKHIIHGDLKPENLMLKHTASGHQLKIIDFGESMHLLECTQLMNFQTLHFRAPEVLICAPRSEKVDMWSAGCILAEMLAGRRLYPGNTTQEQLYLINKCQGPIPEAVLLRGFRTYHYYKRQPNSNLQLLPEEFYENLNLIDTDPYFIFQAKRLHDVAWIDKSATYLQKLNMMMLLELMLYLDDEWRCTPEQALDNDIFTTRRNDE